MKTAKQSTGMATIKLDSGSQVSKYKILSLNTNGIRASLGKNLYGFLLSENPDIFCFYETRVGDKTFDKVIKELSSGEDFKIVFSLYDYVFAASKLKYGYSGTAIFVKKSIYCVSFENSSTLVSETSLINTEGRYTSVELPYFHLINCYVPNSGRGGYGKAPDFLPDRMDWEDEIKHIIAKKQESKPVIYCGDLNVVADKLDIYNWEANMGQPGMTPEEREALQRLMYKCQLLDTFRELHKTERKYSWFSNFGSDRYKNFGWRIDYFLVDKRISAQVVESDVLMAKKDYSDHTPIVLHMQFGTK